MHWKRFFNCCSTDPRYRPLTAELTVHWKRPLRAHSRLQPPYTPLCRLCSTDCLHPPNQSMDDVRNSLHHVSVGVTSVGNYMIYFRSPDLPNYLSGDGDGKRMPTFRPHLPFTHTHTHTVCLKTLVSNMCWSCRAMACSATLACPGHTRHLTSPLPSPTPPHAAPCCRGPGGASCADHLLRLPCFVGGRCRHLQRDTHHRLQIPAIQQKQSSNKTLMNKQVVLANYADFILARHILE